MDQLTGDIARLIADEEQGNVRDLGRRASPTHRRVRENHVSHFIYLVEGSCHVGVDEPGADGVDPNTRGASVRAALLVSIQTPAFDTE